MALRRCYHSGCYANFEDTGTEDYCLDHRPRRIDGVAAFQIMLADALAEAVAAELTATTEAPSPTCALHGSDGSLNCVDCAGLRAEHRLAHPVPPLDRDRLRAALNAYRRARGA